MNDDTTPQIREGADYCPLCDTLEDCWCAFDDPEECESFCQWLEQQGDALASPESFEQWLKQREDSITTKRIW